MPDSLYAQYLKERTDIKIIERDFGFASYSIVGEECFIQDVFILPELRQTSLASQLADEITEIAKAQRCKYLTATVCPSTKGTDIGLKAIISYGMKLHSSINNLIIFKKDIV